MNTCGHKVYSEIHSCSPLNQLHDMTIWIADQQTPLEAQNGLRRPDQPRRDERKPVRIHFRCRPLEIAGEQLRLPVDEVIRDVLAQMETQCDGRRVDVSIAPALPSVFVDLDLIELALRQLIDNALKYSPLRSAIRVSIDAAKDAVAAALVRQRRAAREATRHVAVDVDPAIGVELLVHVQR